MSKLTLSLKARERKRWASTSNPAVSQEQEIVCACFKCGKIFGEPIELTVRAEGSLETYYACPHCFSRVSVSDNLDAVNFYACATYIQRLYLEEQTRK